MDIAEMSHYFKFISHGSEAKPRAMALAKRARQLEWNPGMEPKGPAAPALAPSPKTSVITSMKGPAALALAPSPKTVVIANMCAHFLENSVNLSL